MNNTPHPDYYDRIHPILHSAFLRWLAHEGPALSGILNELAQERAIRRSLHKLADEQADLFMNLVNGGADRSARYHEKQRRDREVELLAQGDNSLQDFRTDKDMLGLLADRRRIDRVDELVIELDIVLQDPTGDLSEEVEGELNGFNGLACLTVRAWTEFRIIEESGSGGGWPNVEVTFRNRDTALAWLTAYCHGNMEDVEYHLSRARRKDA